MAIINWSFWYGQSLAVGASSVPKLSDDPFDSDWTFGANSSGELIPLAMDIDAQQPHYTCGQAADTDGRIQVWTNHGEGGKTYAQLKKGTAFYQRAIDQVTAMVAENPDDQIVCRAIHWVHGEANSNTPKETYAGYIAELLADYNADIKAITGQTEDLHMFLCQISPSSEAGWGQVIATYNNPEYVHLVCPKSYMPKIDGVHLTSPYSWILGEIHGRVHKKSMIDQQNWLPVMPKSVIKSGARTVDIQYHVPEPPLVIRGDLEVALASGRGFNVYDGVSTMTPTVAVLEDGVTVRLTCNRDIVGDDPRVTYYNGNIMDSDPAESTYDDREIPNWSVFWREYPGFIFDPFAPTSRYTDTNSDPVNVYQLVDGEAVLLESSLKEG